jgi:hypothetical protein
MERNLATEFGRTLDTVSGRAGKRMRSILKLGHKMGTLERPAGIDPEGLKSLDFCGLRLYILNMIKWNGKAHQIKVYRDGKLIAQSKLGREAISLIEQVLPNGKNKYHFQYVKKTKD